MDLLNKLVVATIPAIPKPIVRHFAGRYIAGETIADAIRCVRQLNDEGVCATLDVLGEDITNKDEAAQSRNNSIQVLHTIAKEKLDSNLSIKLTSLGLKLGKDVCTENVREILKVAAKYGTFVRFDMEDSTCTTDTIDVFQTLQKEFPNTGIVLQAYMRRSEDDVKNLMKTRTNFRLCKGIYKERPEIAFQGRSEVQDNYLKLLDLMVRNKCYVGIATHDSVLVDGAYKMIKELNLKKNEYEFQMLLGVRPELRKKLVADGHKVRLCKGIYKERPEIAFQGRSEVQDNYLKLLDLMVRNKCYVGIATHDSVLVDGANRMLKELNLKKSEYEFQMLLGVRPELRKKLVADGHKVRLYVPFGEHWYGYSTRRFKENPEVAGYVFKALFTRNV